MGIGVFIAVTHAVGVAAANIFPFHRSPQYLMGCVVTGALGFVAAIGALIMVILLHLDNRSRDKRYGKPEAGKSLHMTGSAHKNMDFRYAL